MIGLNEGGAARPMRVRERTAEIFAEGGALVAALSLEHRPEQERMALAVAAAMADDRPLLFEAGTGVGKSLAYLLPGIVFAVEQGRQLVVSTHTISLQEQIEHQDLPLCRRLFASVPALAEYREFRSTLLVGKSNYLCTTRLAHALQDRAELLATPEQSELQRLAAWAARSPDGLRHELNPAPADDVWDLVNADSSVCSRRHCDPRNCFYQRARARVDAAHVLIVNHSLLFSLLNIGHLAGREGARGVLRQDDFVVLDEAHTVPDVATDHTGTHISNVGLDRLLKSLYHPGKRRGLLAKHGTAGDQQAVADALETAALFFEHLREKLLPQHAIARLRFPDAAEPLLDAPLLAVIHCVADAASRLADGCPPRDEMLGKLERLKGHRAEITRWLGLADEDSVYWLERGGRRGQTVTLRAAPLDVAPYLRASLFQRETSVVLTSATLTVGGAIEPFQQRVGAGGVRTGIEQSPFDFDRQMRVYVAEDMTLPSSEGARLDVAALADYVGFCSLRNAGGTLVLFTSYADMRAVSERLAPVFAAAERTFLMQGRDGSRTELAQRLRRAGDAILFGTDSFWTGVDVPGRALSQVIITRLPFEPPMHPVAEARAERIRAQGGHPFNQLTLPDALMRFRQGVGRLIRQRTDHGVVTLLDARILTKAYGREFIASLPGTSFARMNRANRERIFQPFP